MFINVTNGNPLWVLSNKPTNCCKFGDGTIHSSDKGTSTSAASLSPTTTKYILSIYYEPTEFCCLPSATKSDECQMFL